MVVDGGPLQADAAARALAELGIDDVAVCGLAKRLEEVWQPGEEYPVILPAAARGSTRCSGCGTRRTGSRSPITGTSAARPPPPALSTTCPGSAPPWRKALLTHFGSVRKLRAASIAEIAAVPGIGPRLAATISAALGSNQAETTDVGGNHEDG